LCRVCVESGAARQKREESKVEMTRCFSEEAGKRMKRISELAATFPALEKRSDRDVIGIDPWDADKLERWALGPEPESSERHVVRFLLSLWNPHFEWRCGWFDIHVALTVWDEQNRAAFAKWAENPWWP
jgi:hypothetical protein